MLDHFFDTGVVEDSRSLVTLLEDVQDESEFPGLKQHRFDLKADVVVLVASQYETGSFGESVVWQDRNEADFEERAFSVVTYKSGDPIRSTTSGETVYMM